MAVLKHIHQYIRVKGMTKDGKLYLYRCAHPHCSHREERVYLEGKASLCNTCGAEFKMTYEDTRKGKPQCLNCSQTKDARNYRASKRVTELLFQQNEETTL